MPVCVRECSIGSLRKASLRRSNSIGKEPGNEPCRQLEEEHYRQRKKPVQRLKVGACLECSRTVWLECSEGRGKVGGDVGRAHVLYKQTSALAFSEISIQEKTYREVPLPDLHFYRK